MSSCFTNGLINQSDSGSSSIKKKKKERPLSLRLGHLKIRENEKEIIREEIYKRMHSERMIACEHAVIDELESITVPKLQSLE